MDGIRTEGRKEARGMNTRGSEEASGAPMKRGRKKRNDGITDQSSKQFQWSATMNQGPR